MTGHSGWNKFRRASNPRHHEPSAFGLDLTLEPLPMAQRQIHTSHVPIPGTGSEPPIIPPHTGAAAKAAAALQNQWLRTTSEESNDRESGIGITISAPGFELGAADSGVLLDPYISRVDFITTLPSELAIHVLSLLDAAALTKVARVSRSWHRVCRG